MLDQNFCEFLEYEIRKDAKQFRRREYNVKYKEGFQIIELTFGGQTLSITTMNGDLGEMTFYPTGYLGERVGLLISKTICTSHTSMI